MQEIETTIHTILSNDSALQTLLGGNATNKRIYPEINENFENFPCVVYRLVSSDENTVPANTQNSILEIISYVKTSKLDLENINARIKTLLKYYASDSPKLFWFKKNFEQDLNEKDRLLYTKILRYTVWSRI